MKMDLINTPQKVKADKKEYQFIYNYEMYDELERLVGKGVYQIYDSLMSEKGLTLNESLSLLRCSMMFHQMPQEIDELVEKIKKHPGIWLQVREAVITSFVLPLMPPEILEKTVIKPKKKTK